MTKTVYSVAQINKYISRMVASDGLLHFIYVRGEVSNLKYHSSGHIYFSLKDAAGAMSCAMWRSDRKGLAFPLKDGDKVVVGGSVEVYEKGGTYHLTAKEITREGAGDLYEKYLKLKAELEEMGMFDPIYKKPIPPYAKRIGIVTAPTGAAIQDIRNISRRRNPYVQLILCPALVQGKGAAESIAKGIETLDSLGVDIIIVGRGGGSIEDLWAFNEETVARAIFACGTPVISAVGHETDTTIADFVADLRAPTPSAAAELAVYDVRRLLDGIREREKALRRPLERRIALLRQRSGRQALRLEHQSPAYRLHGQRRRAAEIENALTDLLKSRLTEAKGRRERLETSLSRLMERKLPEVRSREERLRLALETAALDKLKSREVRFRLLLERMKGLNPLDRLKAGYAYVETPSGRAARSISQVRDGDLLTIHVTDGQIRAEVKETRANE